MLRLPVRAKSLLWQVCRNHARHCSAPPCALLLYKRARQGDIHIEVDTRLRAIDPAWISGDQECVHPGSALIGTWSFSGNMFGSAYTIYEDDGQLVFMQSTSRLYTETVQGELFLKDEGDTMWWVAKLSKKTDDLPHMHGMIRLRDVAGKIESQFKTVNSSEWEQTVIATRSFEEPCKISEHGLATENVVVGRNIVSRTLPVALSASDPYSEAKLTEGCLVHFIWELDPVSMAPKWFTDGLAWVGKRLQDYLPSMVESSGQHHVADPTQIADDASPAITSTSFGIFVCRDGRQCYIRPVALYRYNDQLSLQKQAPFEVGAGPLTKFNGMIHNLLVPLEKVTTGKPDIALPPQANAALRACAAHAMPLPVASVETVVNGMGVPNVNMSDLWIPDADRYVGPRAASLNLQLSSVSFRINGDIAVPVFIDPVSI